MINHNSKKMNKQRTSTTTNSAKIAQRPIFPFEGVRGLKSILFFLLILTVSCSKSGHFISDADYRAEVNKQFDTRKNDSNLVKAGVFSVFDRADIPETQKEAMQFLYAYMSLNDLADYDGDFFLRQTRWAFEARDFFSWGKKVPDELFRHFVLPPRVNNEDLDTARVVFFRELKERIKDMNMVDAALEVNHWCHEKVTYRPADSRTSAPLATLRTAFGRCGEESTFTVTALRAVGIPARQCYTPRWAHTDDNHAWVEVWADGKWYFMGACEPEPKLNTAWFTFPAKRAMMVHTNVFGRYYGKESKTDFPLFTKINVLENYTDTKKLTVKITNADGKALTDANVKFQLYNYAEYYPIYEQNTDKNGEAYIISGLGDLLVWAAKDGKYGYKKVSLKDTDHITLALDKTRGAEYADEFDLTPPENKAVYVNDTTADTKRNNIRLHREDSIRNAYLATFMTEKQAEELAASLKLNKADVQKYIAKSEGNYRAISDFLTKNAGDKNALNLLSTLTDKDLRDTPAEILQAHLDFAKNTRNYPENVFVEGVLSPRISLELIRPWRKVLQESFKSIFSDKTTAQDVKTWVNANIRTADSEENYSRCLISPIGTNNIKKADNSSKKVFFVALCRSWGIPAKVDAATGEINVYENGKWNLFLLEPQAKPTEMGKLTITYNVTNGLIPLYWSYYTLAKFDNGFFNTFDFEDDARVAKFPINLDLEAGYYRLTTGNRYADGRVLARNEYFTISKDKNTKKALIIRELVPDNKTYGTINSPLVPADWYNKKGMVICFLEPDREPTKHIMNDLPKYKQQYDQWGGNFLFVVPEEKLNASFNAQSYKGLPKNTRFITANGKQIMDAFLRAANQSFRDNYPLVYIVNPQGGIVFHSEGYRIGVGDLVWKSVSAQHF